MSNATGWGGRREGAGRRPSASDGTPRKMRSIRASDEEWELIKEFARMMKDNTDKAQRLMKQMKCE